jgi:hypothetical protein
MSNINNIDENIKCDLVEVSGSRGVNLTSQNTRIKHNKSGNFTISSNGIINISTVNPEILTTDYNYNGCINLITKNANLTTEEGENNINIVGGSGEEYIQSGSIYLKGGDGLDGKNSDGGDIEIFAGNGTGDGDGGHVRIVSGSNSNGNGANVYIEAGLGLYSSQGISPGVFGGSINFQSGLAGTNCGDIEFYTGTSNIQNLPTTIGPSGDVSFNLGQDNSSPNKIKSGRLRVNYGALKLPVFADTTERNLRIPTPEKGDLCILNDDSLIYYYNGTTWKTLTTN